MANKPKFINIIYLMSLILVLISCNDSVKKKKIMINDNRPHLNNELSFTPYNKKKLEAFVYPSRMHGQEIVKILDTLLEQLDNYEPNLHSAYNVYYGNYYQIIDYFDKAKASKLDIKRNLERAKHILLKGNGFSNDDISALDHFYFIYSCIAMFKADWPINPDLSFSNELIDGVFKDEHELLYNHYQYDNDPDPKSLYHLPLIEKLARGDVSVINPHSIDEKAAKLLLTRLNAFHSKDNGFLNREVEVFRSLLQRVISGEIVLSINNYSM